MIRAYASASPAASIASASSRASAASDSGSGILSTPAERASRARCASRSKRLPSVDAKRLEDAVGIEKAAVEDRNDRLLDRADLSVDGRDSAHAAASRFAREIAASSASRAPSARGSIGAPSRTVTRENGHASPNRSQARRRTTPRSIEPPIGTRTPPTARAAATAPPFAIPYGPRGPSTAKAASARSRRIRRTSAASPRTPPRARPSHDPEPLQCERARLHRPVARQADEHDGRSTPAKGEKGPLRPVKEREHPRARRDRLERRVRHDAYAQRRQPGARDEAEEHAQNRARHELPRPLSSSARSTSPARALSDGSFSIARSSI